jgi:DNA-binding transcriptional regulator YiaG
MTVRYHHRHGSLSPNYLCQREGIERGTPICQDVPGAGVDEAIGELLIATMTPVALEVALTVQNELANRIDEADRLRAKQVERARYDADLARRRYMQVDPSNRLVADSLEAEWNERLRALTAAQEDYERQRLADRKGIDAEQRAQVLALATDFPKLWRDPKTSMRERKRMLRLLVEDVTLLRADVINAHIRFRGGTTRSLTLPLPKCAWELRQTPANVLCEIGELVASHTDEEVAAMLNERGHRSGEGLAFHARMVLRLRREHGLKSRFDRLRDAGMLTRDEVARMLNVSGSTVSKWREQGLLHAERYNDKGSCLYAKPGDGAPTKQQGRRLSRRG